MSKADRDIDGALSQKSGDTSPKVGGWQPSDGGCGFGALAFALIVILAIWGGCR